VLAYGSGTLIMQLIWFDRSGTPVGTLGPPGQILEPAISPDGGTVAFDRRDLDTGNFDIWLHDLARGTESRFTSGTNGRSNVYPVWSPDGSHVAFGLQVFQKAINGAAEEEVVAEGFRADDWSRDGRYLIGDHQDQKPNYIWVLSLAPGKPVPYLHGDFIQRFAKLSPDERWLAYVSNETKRNEVYVQSFPVLGRKVQFSANGGSYPVWSRDGKELFFIAADNKMMAVEVKASGARFEAGLPKPLFDTRFPGGNGWYDVSKDGRFLIPTRIEQTANSAITVVINWTAGLN
jgi:eukaryotic-like serine/threonine-protein kinase